MKTKGLRTRLVSKKQIADISLVIRKAREEQQEQERKKQESITLTVGRHKGCGGDIIYHSFFVIAVPVSEIRFGGKNPMREGTKCACAECGQLFDPFLPKYRKKVEEYRNRK